VNVRIWRVKLRENGQKKNQETLEETIKMDKDSFWGWKLEKKTGSAKYYVKNVLTTMATLPSRLLPSWS